MFKPLLCILASLTIGSALAQTVVIVPAHSVTVPVPAVTPAPVTPPPITFTGSNGQSLSIQPPAVQPAAIPASTVQYTEPAYTITVGSAPPPVPPAAMTGSLAPAGSPSSITDASGGIWTVNAGVVQKGGVAVGVSSGVVLLVMDAKGAFWQENASCLWWTWSGTTWGTTGSATGPAGMTLPTCTPPTAVVTPPPVVTPPAGAQTTVFSFPNGFANAGSAFAPHWNLSAIVNGDCVPGLPPSTGHSAGNCSTTSTFDVSQGFTADVYFKMTNVTGSVTAPSIAALGILIQNELATDHPNDGTWNNGIAYGNPSFGAWASGDANMGGFGSYNYPTQYAILHSVAVKFDMAPTNGQWTTSAFPSVPKAIGATGLYLNGGPQAGLLPGEDMTGNGINLYLPDLFHATLTYDGTNLALVLVDTVTGARYQTQWPVNIQQVIGGKNAFFTITAGEGPSVQTQFHITAATLTTGTPAMPAAPAVTPLAAIAGIAAGPVVPNGSASIAGSTLTLTDNQKLVPATATNEAGSAWSASPLPVSTFHTSFTLQQLQGQGSGGAAFVLQNIPTTTPTGNFQWIAGGPNVVGNSSGYGFSGVTSASGGQLSWLQISVAVKFDYVANTTGLYLAGADPSQNSIAITGLKLGSNPDTVTMSYDGASLAMTITDTVTKGAFTHTWGVNVLAAVGGSTAYVGFTAGAYAATQTVANWTYSN